MEDYINSVIVDSLPSAITLQELLVASESDPTLKITRDCLETGNWTSAPQPFQILKEELCQKRGLILGNDRFVIPDVMRPRILQLAREGHQGITKVNSISGKESGGLAWIFKLRDTYMNHLVAKSWARNLPRSHSE